jgi:hypothetical protein
LRRFPEGLLPMGDSVCSLNPIYGQGMTVAALQALALREHVARSGSSDPRRWLRAVARTADAPWDMVVGGDLAFQEVEGRRTAKVRLLGAYVARLHAAAAHDPIVAIAFARVMSLVDPPTALLRPRIAVRVLGRSRRPSRRFGGEGSTQAPDAANARHEEVRR